MGMEAKDIAQFYLDMGQTVFPPLTPDWFPKALEPVDEYLRMMFQPSLYSNEKLIELLKSAIQQQTGKADLTLAELNEMLGPDKALILTAVNINERRTRFLKSYKEDNGDWKLWEAILASSSAPIALPVWPRVEAWQTRLLHRRRRGQLWQPRLRRGARSDRVSRLRAGRGECVELRHGLGERRQLREGQRRADRLARSQLGHECAQRHRATRRALNRSTSLKAFGNNQIDYRRFQFALEQDISADAYGDDATYAFMQKLGDDLGERIRRDQFAPNADPQFDPEGLYTSQMKYRDAITVAQSRSAQ